MENNWNNNTDPFSVGNGAPQSADAQDAWTRSSQQSAPHADNTRREFFDRYRTVFREEPQHTQASSSSYGAAKPSPRRARRTRTSAAVLAACLVLSLAGGFAGGFAAAKLSGTSSGGTVLYESSSTGLTGLSAGTQTVNVSDIVAVTAPSVVEITTESVQTNAYFGQYVTSGAGSGVIISADGYIVTNNHVIEGASKITVRLSDGSEYNAALIGTDSKTDLAVIRIDADGLTPAVLGDSDALQVGEFVLAIGNPLGELGGTVTDGIISALSRDVTVEGQAMTLLQTNAALSPGNSGGGLFNQRGELIGIVNSKSSGSDVEGLGFAIPVNTAKAVIENLIDYGYVRGRAALGVSLIDITDARTAMSYRVQYLGVYVASVTPNSGAAAAGLQAGDCILSANGQKISASSELSAIIDGASIGDQIELEIYRDGSSLNVSVTLQEYTPTT